MSRQRQTWVILTAAVTMAACGSYQKNPDLPPVVDDVAGSGGTSSGGAAGTGVIGQSGTPTTVGGGAGTPPVAQAGMGAEAPVEHAPAPTYPGYTLVLEEHFDEPLDLNTDPIWTWSDGGMQFGQVRFVEEAVSFADGVMKITTAAPEAAVAASPSFAENTEVTSKPFTSGQLRTKFNNYRYGRYEARIKAPIPVPGARSDGNFVTSFTTSRTPFQEDYREISFDLYGGRPDALLTNIVLWPDGIDGETRDNYAVQQELPAGFDTAAFHTYAFVWGPDFATWYIDDEPLPVRDSRDNAGAPPTSDLSAKLMLGTWIFNDSYAFGGITGSLNVYPFTTEVDFIRVYKQDGEIYPCDAPPACLPAEDLNASKNNPNETDTEG